MSIVYTDNQYYQDIADAIRSKNGSSDTYLPSEMAAAIEDISGGGSSGGGGSASDPVKFIDYDGTILHSYSVADFMALTAMPENPSHSGLTAQGWNWSLADAKAQLTAMPEAGLTIGQMYITDDGKTRIYVHFEEARKSPYFGICPNGTVTIDWGDGSATSTLTGTSLTTVKTVQHEFPSAGDYVITLTLGGWKHCAFFGTSSTSHILKASTGTSNYTNYVYTGAIRKVELGAGMEISSYGFSRCVNLTSVTIPAETSMGMAPFYYCYNLSSLTFPSGITDIGVSSFTYCHSMSSVSLPNSVINIGRDAFSHTNLAMVTLPMGLESVGSAIFSGCTALTSIIIPSDVTNIEDNLFNGCYAIKSVTIPNGVTSIGGQTFTNCYTIKSVTIPNGVTSLGFNAFSHCESLTSLTIPDNITEITSGLFGYCYSLSSITIPSGVESIATSAFAGCYGMKEYHFLPTTPPTLANTNVFQNIRSECIIYVPQGSLEAYKTATNWSTYASKMREEPTS